MCTCMYCNCPDGSLDAQIRKAGRLDELSGDFENRISSVFGATSGYLRPFSFEACQATQLKRWNVRRMRLMV